MRANSKGGPLSSIVTCKALEREIAYCSAAPRILEDPTAARSTLPYVTIKLLLLRVIATGGTVPVRRDGRYRSQTLCVGRR